MRSTKHGASMLTKISCSKEESVLKPTTKKNTKILAKPSRCGEGTLSWLSTLTFTITCSRFPRPSSKSQLKFIMLTQFPRQPCKSKPPQIRMTSEFIKTSRLSKRLQLSEEPRKASWELNKGVTRSWRQTLCFQVRILTWFGWRWLRKMMVNSWSPELMDLTLCQTLHAIISCRIKSTWKCSKRWKRSLTTTSICWTTMFLISLREQETAGLPSETEKMVFERFKALRNWAVTLANMDKNVLVYFLNYY